MANVTDILCDEDGDLACAGGDIVIGESTFQHMADLLDATEGAYKQSPVSGVGIAGYLNDENPQSMLKKVRQQFITDGMMVKRIKFVNNVLTPDAEYK